MNFKDVGDLENSTHCKYAIKKQKERQAACKFLLVGSLNPNSKGTKTLDIPTSLQLVKNTKNNKNKIETPIRNHHKTGGKSNANYTCMKLGNNEKKKKIKSTKGE